MKQFILMLLIVLVSMNVRAVTIATIEIGSGKTYATLALAENAIQGEYVANDSAVIYEISGTWSAQSATTIDGSTTDATHNITIVTVGSARHSGVWSTSAYRFDVISTALALFDNFITLDGIQAVNNGTQNFRYIVNATGTDVIIRNCLLQHSSSGDNGTCIRVINTASTSAEIYNNIIWIDGSDIRSNDGITIAAMSGEDGFAKVYNNTIVNCRFAIITSYRDTDARNNIAWNCSLTVFGTAVYHTQEYNATDTSTLAGTNNITSMADPFVDLSGEDFHLASGSADPAEDGTDLSGTVVEDIDGDTRPQSTLWDIGADEFASAGGSDPLFRRRRLLQSSWYVEPDTMTAYGFAYRGGGRWTSTIPSISINDYDDGLIDIEITDLQDLMDVTGDSKTNITDIVALIDIIFRQQRPPETFQIVDIEEVAK